MGFGYDSSKGTLFGRDAKSWLRITVFYIIYYSLLAIIMYLFVTQYQATLPEVGKSKPKIVTRVDEPGTGAFPFVQIPDKVDKDNQLILDTTGSGTDGSKAYVKEFKAFAESYNGGDVCTGEDVKSKTCKVKNAELITDLNIQKWLADKTPVVGLGLNKVIGWKPVSYNLNVKYESYDNNAPVFTKNSVNVKCYETDVGGYLIKNSNFEITFLENSQSSITEEYFPYMGKDKLSGDELIKYNKPFVLVQIKSKAGVDAWGEIKKDNEGKEISDKKTPSFFSCYWDANNLSTPSFPETWADDENVKNWSMELEKMAIGITKFSIMFQD